MNRVTAATRTYDSSTYRKHKDPGSWGSPCPNSLPNGVTAQALLVSGVLDGRSVYNVEGDYAFAAEEHAPGTWHGYPIPWSRLPWQAVEQLHAAGRLTIARWRKAVRKSLGHEFDR